MPRTPRHAPLERVLRTTLLVGTGYTTTRALPYRCATGPMSLLSKYLLTSYGRAGPMQIEVGVSCRGWPALPSEWPFPRKLIKINSLESYPYGACDPLQDLFVESPRPCPQG